MIATLPTAATTAWNYDHMHLSPVALDLGVVQLRWYALSYMAMILLGWWYLLRPVAQPDAPMARRHVDSLVSYVTPGGGLAGCSAPT